MRGRFTFGLLSIALLAGCASDNRSAEEKQQAKLQEQARRDQAKHEEQERKEQQRAQEKRAGQRRWELGQHMFRHEDEPTLVDAFAERSAANGALEDANFNNQHFDGNDLNSLGRSKLNLLLSSVPPSGSVTVYVAGDSALANARMASLSRSWKSSKYGDIQLQAKEGRNPAVMSPASDGIRGLQKLDQPEAEGAQPIDAGELMGQMLGVGQSR